MITAQEAKNKTLSKERVEALEVAAFENYWEKTKDILEQDILKACNQGLNTLVTPMFGSTRFPKVVEKLNTLGYKTKIANDLLEISW